MKTGIVDVGGGLRDIYGAGVLDFYLDQGISFDYGIGVSAGSANLASFFAGQRGRNYRFYTEFALRKEYISFRNWLKDRNYVNLNYGYGTLSNSDGEYPLDYAALQACKSDFVIVATDARTGKPHYFDRTDLKQDDYGPIKASSCVPAANRAYVVGGVPYYDGGLSDPIPFEMARRNGCEKVVIILTRPKDYRRTIDKDKFAARLIRRRYPNAAAALIRRAETYNAELDRAVELERQGEVLILAPDSIEGMKMLSGDKEQMERLYRKGYADAAAFCG